MSRRTASLTGLALVCTLAVGILLGAWMPRDDDFFELRKNFEIFGAAYEELVTGYVEPLDAERLMRVGMEAMLSDLDPYTTFIDEADNTDLNIITRGRYGGVGLNVGRRGGKITVIAPVEGASGYKQGVRAGDVLHRVADQPTDSLSVGDVRTLLRGEPGTTVNVTVRREGTPTPIEFTLTREQVTLQNVSYRGFLGEEASGIAYVKLERFARESGSEVQSALTELRDRQALRGVVLDLRDNPGGLLKAAVSVTELFVPQGATIVSTRGRLPETNRTYESDRTPAFPDVPLVVLVNDFSASASEIVAGAVQDLDRGVVMGTTTYGKGLVQVVRNLPHNTSLKMTTAQYFTPSGRSIQNVDYTGGGEEAVPDSAGRTFETEAGRTVRDRHGIEPDVTVSAGDASELEKALQRKAAFFFYANHYAAGRDTLSAGFEADAAVLDDFQQWLDDEGFDYATRAERSVADLRERLQKQGYPSVGDEVDALQAALRDAKADGFDRHAADLQHHLEREILARFVSESRQIQASLRYDAQVDSAVALIEDAERYRDILSPEE
jgi:carboxyl-terminal processing protease